MRMWTFILSFARCIKHINTLQFSLYSAWLYWCAESHAKCFLHPLATLLFIPNGCRLIVPKILGKHMGRPYLIIWLVVYLPLWKIWVRQLGWLFHILWKKHVPNHQPVIIKQQGFKKNCSFGTSVKSLVRLGDISWSSYFSWLSSGDPMSRRETWCAHG